MVNLLKNITSIKKNQRKLIMIKTIPDLITDIKYYYKRLIDIPLGIMERVGSKMSVYAWNKRWGNREKGTGFKNG